MQLDHAIGVIDIGSNSFHLVVGGYHNRDYFKIIDDLKVNVRLCEGLAETGYMSEARMRYGEETLEMFKYLCESYKLEKIIIIATAAVRKAKNGPEFVARIKKNLGLDITVISGEREAELDYLGCVNSLDVKDALMMDIGGGSAELVLIKERKKVDGISLPFGSIDLMEMFDIGDKVTGEKLKKLRKFLKEQYAAVAFLKQADGLPVIGVGGTIRNIGRIHRRQIDYPLELAHNYRMDYAEVCDTVDLAADLDYESRRRLEGLSKGRTDIFVGASYACRYLMKTIGSKELIISDSGLRNGVLYDYFGNGPDNLVMNMFDRALVNTMLMYDVNMGHAYHLLGIANKLSIDLKSISGVKQDFSKIMKCGACLHDVGTFIQYRNHHEHSFYLILNSGLYGISQKGMLLAAFMALNHRTNKKIQIDKPYQVLLTEDDRHLIDELSLYLQIGEYLDRAMDGVVRDIRTDIGDDAVTLHVTSVVHPVMTNIVEDECAKKFKRVFGKDLKVEAILTDTDIPDALQELNTY